MRQNDRLICDGCGEGIAIHHTRRYEVADGTLRHYHGLPGYVKFCASVVAPDHRATFRHLMDRGYFMNVLEPAAHAYVRSVYEDAYPTIERGDHFIRTPEFRNYLGKSAHAGGAWIDAARILMKLEDEGRLEAARADAYPNHP
jgi:hypothetical protein